MSVRNAKASMLATQSRNLRHCSTGATTYPRPINPRHTHIGAPPLLAPNAPGSNQNVELRAVDGTVCSAVVSSPLCAIVAAPKVLHVVTMLQILICLVFMSHCCLVIKHWRGPCLPVRFIARYRGNTKRLVLWFSKCERMHCNAVGQTNALVLALWFLWRVAVWRRHTRLLASAQELANSRTTVRYLEKRTSYERICTFHATPLLYAGELTLV